MLSTTVTLSYRARKHLSQVLFLIATCILVPLQAANAQEAISETMLESLKAATVFVRVDMGHVGGTGSGFLINKKGDYAYIVTNEHVVRREGRGRRTVEVDFFSGTTNRRSFEATVLSEDASRDLAVLRIANHKDIPKPISLKPTHKVRETQSVFIFGFPFGDALATNRLGPNVTIGKGTISSLRTDDFGEIEHVQVDGDINPGNSGGPIVFSDGSLMGVSVATVIGTQIGIGIPGESVLQMLDGRIGSLTISQESQRPKLTTCRLNAGLIDPLQRIESVSFFYIKEDQLSDEDIEPGEDGRWSKISTRMKRVRLSIDGQTATAEEDFRGDYGERIRIIHQIRFENGSGETFYTGPDRYTIKIPERAKDPNRIARRKPEPRVNPERPLDRRLGKQDEKETEPEEMAGGIDRERRKGGWLGSEDDDDSPNTNFKIAPEVSGKSVAADEFECLDASCQKLNFDSTKLIPNIVWDSTHEHFFVLSNQGLLRKISFPELIEVTTIDFGTKCTCFEMSAEGICVLNSGLQDLIVVDPETLEPISKFPSGEATHFAATPENSKAYLATHGRLMQLDLNSGRHTKVFTGKDFPENTHGFHTFDKATLSPDGQFLICDSRGHLAKYRVKGDRLIWDQRGPHLGSNSSKIVISDDSRYLAMPCGGGNGKGYTTHIYSIDDLTDRVLEVQGGAYPRTLAFDQAAGKVYGQNHENELITFTGRGLVSKSYNLVKRGGETKHLSVHPDGNNVIVMTPPAIIVVQLPTE